VCEPTAIASTAMGVIGAVGEQAAAEQAVSAKNRAKLKNHERNNIDYITQATLNNAKWKNDVQIGDIKEDQVYMAMIDQWTKTDQELDEIFSKGHYKVEKAIRKMYQNDYAGTQTGNTAARLAQKSVKEMGYEKAETLHHMLFAEESAMLDKDIAHRDAESKQWDIYDKIRFSPIHGHAPPPPLMDKAPSRAGMFLSIAGSVFSGFAGADAANKGTDWTLGSGGNLWYTGK
tara:strand:- start:3378 stop:4070 length:693 start_codon:yes stop_codon:yes gene_type:complete